MRVLIMSVTTGEGHNSTAKAMHAYFTKAGVECDILDTYGYVSPTIANSINKTYLWLASHAKSAYKLGYRLMENRKPPKNEEAPSFTAQIINLPFVGEIHEYIKRNQPDTIIFTHSFAGMILDILKRDGRVSVPTVGILTDFTFHPFWENCTANDYVVMPSRALRYQAYRKGVRDEQLRDFGIPINPKFADRTPKAEARAALGLDPDTPTLLLMGGSMGYGNMQKSLAALDNLTSETDFQIIAVCGNNEKAKKEIEAAKTRRRVLCLGFVNNVDQLMDAADCIVTKPGGLTTSESLAKGLPMIIVNPIPGQEARNAEFLLNCGAAVAVNDMCPVEELVCRMLEEPIQLASMRMCIDALAHPHSTRDVCEFVLSLGPVSE